MGEPSFERVKEILGALRSMNSQERAAYLDRVCADDSALREEVESLLDHGDVSDDFLKTPALGSGTDSILSAALGSPPTDDLTQVGPYRLVRRIASGGMGTVYEAEQSHPRRRVALKVIRGDAVSEDSLRRFRAETEILGRLQHPGIAQIYEAGTYEDDKGEERPFFAMEFIEGDGIRAFVNARSLSLVEKVELFIGICQAVQYAHQKGVIHRDLKPDNIMVVETGTDSGDIERAGLKAQPKVLDFGVARVSDEGANLASKHTIEGQWLGTLQYMSPEQVKGDSREIDTRSDVYALGLILYELLAGVPAQRYPSASLAEIGRRILEDDPSPIVGLPKAHRTDLKTIVWKAIAKSRSERYQTAGELASDLRRCLDHDTITARPHTTWYQLRRFARRHVALIVGMATTATALIAGTIVATLFAVQAHHLAIEAENNATLASEREADALGAEQLARERYDGVMRLADLKDLSDLVEESEHLWPAHPHRLPELERWLDRADLLLKNRPAHERALAALREKARSASSEERGESEDDEEKLIFDDSKEAWWYQMEQGLLKDLDAFVSPDPYVGVYTNVKNRIEVASTIEALSLDDYEDVWEEAIEEIELEELYGGLTIRPQMGLVPLGPDPDSNLWEFWHVESGESPQRDPATDKISVKKETGMVFVLLPGGSARVGAQPLSFTEPHYYDLAEKDEQPVTELELDPFFLSKYEMTKAQWWRMTYGEEPSYYRPGHDLYGHEFVEVQPVENVSWNMCDSLVKKFGLLLPTEFQWEYACRGGTETPWWPGDDVTDLEGRANLSDRSAREGGAPWPGDDSLEDGFIFYTAVDALEPNPFGLHHMHGNVWEWCRDWQSQHYRYVFNPGDGFRARPKSYIRVFRGGAFSSAPNMARSSKRYGGGPDIRDMFLGLRPSRLLDR